MRLAERLFRKWKQQKQQLEFAGDCESAKRLDAIFALIKAAAPDVEPLFISDKSSLPDFTVDWLNVTAQKLSTIYGVGVSINDVRLPLWRLVDVLGERRQGR